MIKKRDRFLKLKVLALLYIGYMLYNSNRAAISFIAAKLIKQDKLFTMSQYGYLLIAIELTYGLSKFWFSSLADLFNPGILFSLGLFFAGLSNILFPTATAFPIMLALMAINGVFQGLGWPSLARMLVNISEKSVRGTWWSILSTSGGVSKAFFGYLVVLLLSVNVNHKANMFISGALGMVFAIYLFKSFRSIPNIKKSSCDTAPKRESKAESSLSVIKDVISNKYLWALFIASFALQIMKSAASAWLVPFFLNYHKYDQAMIALTLFNVGSLVGSLLSGPISDYAFKGRRTGLTLLSCLGIFLSAVLFLEYYNNISIATTLFFLIGIFISVAYTLFGLIATELSSSVATATGFIGLGSKIGAIVSHLIMIYIVSIKVHNKIYSSVFLTCSILCAILLVPVMYNEYRKSRRC